MISGRRLWYTKINSAATEKGRDRFDMTGFKLPRERREALVTALQQYFLEERGEQIGSIAAEGLLEFFIRSAGPSIYNEALRDARKVVMERMAAVEDELYTLEKTDSRR